MHYRSNIFIFTGLLSALVLWLAKDLIYQYQNYDTGLNLLPITLFEILIMALFLLAFVLICVANPSSTIDELETPEIRYSRLLVSAVVRFLSCKRDTIEITPPFSLIDISR